MQLHNIYYFKTAFFLKKQSYDILFLHIVLLTNLYLLNLYFNESIKVLPGLIPAEKTKRTSRIL